ncbi:hypothetical protein [Sphingobacterium corticibacter]|uniref:Uncharacterized protein n=1 Tax=Sphingobacterium corticibacter TaxID=2171749 RepID=A0A2T8HLJ1_9SPHI|nr:hypothetical protein [Sphingobacterium corticibacter]PVH26321.1 hypothetical protein DC487_01450 [Sphingobacterium corticibacter]
MTFKELIEKHRDKINLVGLSYHMYPNVTQNTAKTKLSNKLKETESGSGKQRILPHDEDAARKALISLRDDLIKFIGE